MKVQKLSQLLFGSYGYSLGETMLKLHWCRDILDPEEKNLADQVAMNGTITPFTSYQLQKYYQYKENNEKPSLLVLNVHPEVVDAFKNHFVWLTFGHKIKVILIKAIHIGNPDSLRWF
ncbi:uncharacterized protein [Rhodnius prolixus]|uniref:uncharacterized protein n=1 Tax=Rhodnius prolixus TaxID=13249 RepID=UPI003D18A86C